MSGGPEAAAADHAGAWHRLHPLSPLIRSGRRVLALLVLAGFGTTGMVGQGGGPHWYDLAIVGAAVVAAVVEWLVTRWTLDGSTLRIETGLLRRDSRQLPVARIQAVDVVRPFAARMLGLAELRVRLAGSSHADGRLAYLTEPAAEQLRARLLAAHHGLDPATPEPGEQVVTTVPTGRLIGSVVLPAIPLAVAAAAAGVVLALVSPAGLAAVAVPLGWWLIGFTTVTWRRVSSQYGFTVAASPDGIRIRRGLLGTVAETIPMQRVQAVRMIQPLLWRPWSWCRLEVDVAGHPGPEREEGVSEARKALLAVGRPEEAYRLVRLAVGAETPALTRPPLRARWRAPLSYHFLAAGHSGDLAVAVTGRVRRVTIWMPLAKAQSVRYVQGPLQRFLGLATVHLDAAGSHVHAVFAERTQQEAAGLVSELAALSRSARQQGRPPAPPPPSGPLTNRPVPLDGQLLDDGPPLDGQPLGDGPPLDGQPLGDGPPLDGTPQAGSAAPSENAAHSDV